MVPAAGFWETTTQSRSQTWWRPRPVASCEPRSEYPAACDLSWASCRSMHTVSGTTPGRARVPKPGAFSGRPQAVVPARTPGRPRHPTAMSAPAPISAAFRPCIVPVLPAPRPGVCDGRRGSLIAKGL